jgi:hypothetical protein
MRVTMSSSFVASIKEKKNRKKILVVFFFSIVLSSIEREKNRRAIFVDLFFDRALSSISLSSSFVNFESRFVTQSSRSFFSSTFKRIAILFDALMKNVVNLSEICLSAKYLTKLHHDAFFSISFTFESSFDAFRSRKKIRKMITSILKKRIKSSKESCDCVMSSRWRKILTQVNLMSRDVTTHNIEDCENCVLIIEQSQR